MAYLKIDSNGKSIHPYRNLHKYATILYASNKAVEHASVT